MKHVVLIAPAVEDYCVEYANAISATCRVTMFCPAAYFAGQAPFVDRAVDLRLLDWPRHRSLRNPLFIARLARMIRAAQPDVVHFLSEGVLWLNLLLFSLRRYPIVTTVHDVSYHLGDRDSQRVPRWSANVLIHRSDRIVVHGPALRAEAERLYSRRTGRIEVLPHRPITKYKKIADHLSLRRQSADRLTVLFFGRIYAYKGLEILIQSAAEVIAQVPNAHFIIAGRGEDIERYTRLITEPRNFTFLNRYLSNEETAQLFTDADIVALPYVEASQSGVLAIAQAFGKPVVATDVGELGHSVRHDDSGLVVPPRDPVALARALIALAQDEGMRRRLGGAGGMTEHGDPGVRLFAEKAARIYDAAGARLPTVLETTAIADV